jgi:hypothetical protein
MHGSILLAEGDVWAGGVERIFLFICVVMGFNVLCISVVAYYISVHWRKAREARIEADLKREMIQKGLSADEMERVLKVFQAFPPPRQ